jgi:hypothetical protein
VAYTSREGKNYCNLHVDKPDFSPCEHIMTKGPRKGAACGSRTAEGSRCKKHIVDVNKDLPPVKRSPGSRDLPALLNEGKSTGRKTTKCRSQVVAESHKCKRHGDHNGYCRQHASKYEPLDMPSRRCQAEVKTYRKCKLNTIMDSLYCRVHQPEIDTSAA